MKKTKPSLGKNVQEIIKENKESLKSLEANRAKHLNHFEALKKNQKILKN